MKEEKLRILKDIDPTEARFFADKEKKTFSMIIEGGYDTTGMTDQELDEWSKKAARAMMKKLENIQSIGM